MFGKMLTANRSDDNARVWLSVSGRWVYDIDEAFVARHAEAVTGLTEARRIADDDGSVSNVTLVDVEEIGTRRHPLHSSGWILAVIGNSSHSRKAA